MFTWPKIGSSIFDEEPARIHPMSRRSKQQITKEKTLKTEDSGQIVNNLMAVFPGASQSSTIPPFENGEYKRRFRCGAASRPTKSD